MTLQELEKMVDDICPDKPAGLRRVLVIFQHVGAKPCPFCGQKAELYYRRGREAGHDGWATLGCQTDDCRGNTPMGIPPVADFAKEMARWNRRANK